MTLNANLNEKQIEANRAKCRRWYARNKVAQRARVQRYVDAYPQKAKAAVTRYSRSPRGRYSVHKSGTAKRGIGWEFTFETWWAMWKPYWKRRGNATPDSLVMARNGDVGPYSPTNVRIITRRENSLELQINKPQRKRGTLHSGIYPHKKRQVLS